jgi:hypothetical protein
VKDFAEGLHIAPVGGETCGNAARRTFLATRKGAAPRPAVKHAHGATHAAEGPESVQRMKARRISPGPSQNQSSAIAWTRTTAKWLSATSSSTVVGSASGWLRRIDCWIAYVNSIVEE